MVEGKYLYGNDDLTPVYQIRQEVFCGGDTQQSPKDPLDTLGIHVIARKEQEITAAGRLLYDGETYRLDKIAVLKEHRRQKYGDFIVRMLIYRGMEAGAEKFTADVPLESVSFFASIGFEGVGEEYEKDGVVSLPMELQAGKLHTCCCK